MIVIDASVAFKWLRSDDEKYHENAARLLKRHSEGKEKITVPILLYIEIANALATKTIITQTKMKEDLKFLYEVKLLEFALESDDLIQASRLAKKYNSSVYDMLYAVIAKKNNAILYTADQNFVKRTGLKHVKHISEVSLEN